jgi:hypothetical protein
MRVGDLSRKMVFLCKHRPAGFTKKLGRLLETCGTFSRASFYGLAKTITK